MYDFEALERKIAKEGLTATIQYLTSSNLPQYLKDSLEEEGIFRNGQLRLELFV